MAEELAMQWSRDVFTILPESWLGS